MRTRSDIALGGLAGWLWDKLRGSGQRVPRLALLERIALAPRQSLSLVEAEGRRILVATSAEGGPAFYALDERPRSMVSPGPLPTLRPGAARHRSRISW
jgi:flagellar biogenesis protein FliO